MKIKVTNKKSGLKVGETYDLCEMAAKNLIRNGYAVLAKKEKDNESDSK